MSTTAPLHHSPVARFQVAKVTGTLGAEVSGIDLSADLDDATIADIESALVEHKVLFFRDQPMTTQQHLAFARRFGPLEINPINLGRKAGPFTNSLALPELVVVESKAEARGYVELWHSDVSWREDPSLGSVLRCTVAPAYGGDTLWADMAAAYESLDDATRSSLSGMVAIHDWRGPRASIGNRATGGDEDRLREMEEKYPLREHPVVRTHPVSGAKIIYVNPTFTVRIKDMSEAESSALLARLFHLAWIPEFQVRFRWRPNSVAFWDNRSTQHRVIGDFGDQHRRMERVTINGDRPF
jgi:taurine dioxygenase